MPWLTKSYFFTGNPVWPLFNDFFDGNYWDKEHQERESEVLLGRELSIINYIRVPWDIHVQKQNDDNRSVHDGELLGPFFMVFLPLYFFLRKNRTVNLLFFLIFAYMTMWFFASFHVQHIIFVGTLIAIISSYVIIELFKNKYLSKVLKILLIFTFSFNFLIWVGGNAKDMLVPLGLESEDSFYERQAPIYKPSKFINSNLPGNSRILLVREVKGFFLERDYVWDNPSTQVYINHSKFKNEKDYYEELKKLGITHILVNDGSFAKYRGFTVKEETYLAEKVFNITNNLLEKYTTNLYNKDNWLVNEIK
jgi:hypothetical protein